MNFDHWIRDMTAGFLYHSCFFPLYNQRMMGLVIFHPPHTIIQFSIKNLPYDFNTKWEHLSKSKILLMVEKWFSISTMLFAYEYTFYYQRNIYMHTVQVTEDINAYLYNSCIFRYWFQLTVEQHWLELRRYMYTQIF